MKDILNKILYSGLGLASLTKDKIEEIAEKISKESDFTQEEGKKLLEELKIKAEKAKNELQESIDKLSDKAYEKLNVAQKEELEKMKARIAELEEKIKQLLKKDDSSDS